MRKYKPKPPSRRKNGRTITHHGYVRITSGEYRGMLEHRVVLIPLCKEFCYYPLSKKGFPELPGLPDGFTVEHLNHNRQHNCICNLILLDTRIHRYISWRSWLGKDRIGEIANQDIELGPDDYNGTTRYTSEEIAEVPF